MATYIIHMLLEKEGTNPEYIENLNFHILPIANPDGYEYSRDQVNFVRNITISPQLRYAVL